MKTINFSGDKDIHTIAKCPVCNKTVFDDLEGANNGVQPCKHLLLVWLYHCGGENQYVYAKSKIDKNKELSVKDFKLLDSDPLREIQRFDEQDDSTYFVFDISENKNNSDNKKERRCSIKTIKYDGNVNIVCPVCKKVLLRDPDDNGKGGVEMSPCKHTKLWYNDCLAEFVHVNRSFKKILAKTQKDNPDDDGDAFERIAKSNHLPVIRYNGGELGGGVEAIDLIVFQE